MWRAAALILIGMIIGVAFGLAVGFFVYPFVFPPPAAMDELTAEEKANLVAMGTFLHANPSDPIHWGKGAVSIYERTLFLNPDFEVGPGPAFHVYLVPRAGVRHSGDVKETMYVDLGALRAFSGSQKYPIPAGVDLQNYPTVVIWCARFEVLISPADLQFSP